MKIYVINSSNKRIILDVEPTDTIENIKDKIQDIEGYIHEEIILFLMGFC